jgi:hypothetical protein
VLLVDRAPASVPGTDRALVVSDPAPRLVGSPSLAPGQELALGTREAGQLGAVELIELTTTTIPVR